MRLCAEPEGPWPLESAWARAPDGATTLTYSASKAGQYRLAVLHGRTREALPGSPFALAVRAAAADAGRSTAVFIDGARPSAAGAAAPAVAATLAVASAGAPVSLAVTLRDRFGNLAAGASPHAELVK